MSLAPFSYSLIIREHHLDSFQHVNNATYLSILEEARWELLTSIGYGMQKILALGIGPTILEIKLKFLKEIRLRDEIHIETRILSYQQKIGTLQQKVYRGEELCCEADFVIGLFDLKNRKLISPTEEWLAALGLQNN